MPDPVAYGQTRQRRELLTYAEIERAANDMLLAGTKPSIEGVRAALGGGSPKTILNGLNRYWRDLGNQVTGKPDTLRRLPAAVADLADGLWQRALSVATEAALATTTEVDGQLSRLKNQLEVRAHSLSQREVELDELLRSRERTVKELEDNLRAAITMLTKRDVALASLESRLAAAQQETQDYRQRFSTIIQRAVVRNKRAAPKRVAKTRKLARAPRPPKDRKSKRNVTMRAKRR